MDCNDCNIKFLESRVASKRKAGIFGVELTLIFGPPFLRTGMNIDEIGPLKEWLFYLQAPNFCLSKDCMSM